VETPTKAKVAKRASASFFTLKPYK
jgi:hypothetical protein